MAAETAGTPRLRCPLAAPIFLPCDAHPLLSGFFRSCIRGSQEPTLGLGEAEQLVTIEADVALQFLPRERVSQYGNVGHIPRHH